jgi:MYXO-CTERM domain-containing protein
MAIWYLMDPTGTVADVPGVTSDSATMSYVTAAQNATLNSSMFSNVVIYSPTNTTNQRFMALTATPEPGSLTMALVGGVAILFGRRRRRDQKPLR